jgi:hypothetical protein
MGDKTGAYRVLVGTREGKRPLGNPGVDGRVIINCIFKKLDGEAGMDWMDLTEVRERWWAPCECGNELSGSVKCGEFLD